MSPGKNVLRLSKNLLSLISLFATASFFVLFAVTFNNFPNKNIYFENFLGIEIGFNRSSIFIVFCICAVANGLLFIISRFSTLYKYPVKITADNIEMQYHLSKIMLSSLQICVAVFCWFSLTYIYARGVHGYNMPSYSYLYVIPLVAIAIIISYRIAAKAYK